MAKKTTKRKKTKEIKTNSRKSKFQKSIVQTEMEKIEKIVGEGAKEIEDWMIQRKKFLFKLAWVVGLIAVLLIVSHYYMSVPGFG